VDGAWKTYFPTMAYFGLTYSQAFPKKPMKLSWQLLFSKIWDQQFLPMDVPKLPNQCNKLQYKFISPSTKFCCCFMYIEKTLSSSLTRKNQSLRNGNASFKKQVFHVCTTEEES
jgi:hypothetical protein